MTTVESTRLEDSRLREPQNGTVFCHLGSTSSRHNTAIKHNHWGIACGITLDSIKVINTYDLIIDILLNLHSHDLRVPVGSLSRFKLCLPQCNVPGVLNYMSGRLSGFPSLY